jgi:methionyl-tRNA formyltransferase
VRLLLRVVTDLAESRRIEVPQDEKLATWEPAMDSAPLFKPELIALPGATPVDGNKWALHAQ